MVPEGSPYVASLICDSDQTDYCEDDDFSGFEQLTVPLIVARILPGAIFWTFLAVMGDLSSFRSLHVEDPS